jgi:hypothetical protein
MGVATMIVTGFIPTVWLIFDLTLWASELRDIALPR